METWNGNLSRLFEKGSRIVLWGAGAKGVTFLNTQKAGRQIEYVVDINPRKQGMYVAGTGQRIVAPEFLSKYRPETILAGYLPELARTQAAFEGSSTGVDTGDRIGRR